MPYEMCTFYFHIRKAEWNSTFDVLGVKMFWKMKWYGGVCEVYSSNANLKYFVCEYFYKHKPITQGLPLEEDQKEAGWEKPEGKTVAMVMEDNGRMRGSDSYS